MWRKLGQGWHEVRPGENIHSLAYESGHSWKAIWDDPANAALKAKRSDPEVLAAGDSVYVPSLVPAGGIGDTDKRHSFRRIGVPSFLRFRPLYLGEPFADEPYRVALEGEEIAAGWTQADGLVQCAVRPDASRATVTIGQGWFRFTYDVELRTLTPIETAEGVQERLRQLGYVEAALEDAITLFQRHHGLEATGEADAPTVALLHRKFGR